MFGRRTGSLRTLAVDGRIPRVLVGMHGYPGAFPRRTGHTVRPIPAWLWQYVGEGTAERHTIAPCSWEHGREYATLFRRFFSYD
jgi:hypothetical protein